MQRGAAEVDAQRAEEGALTHRPVDRGTRSLGQAHQRCKIDRAGQVAQTGIGETLDHGVALHRLQRVGQRQARLGEVDQKGRATVSGDAPGDGARAGLPRRGNLGDASDRGAFRQAGGDRRQGTLRGGKHGHQSAVTPVQQPFAPARRCGDELPDRQGVEKLVGDQVQRAVCRKIVERSMPGHRVTGEGGLLAGHENRACLDQMEREGLGAAAGPRDGAQGVGHQGAPARPQFGQHGIGGLPGGKPAGGMPQSDQLAEHLADFGRGGEVARRAQGITRGVIAVIWIGQRGGHEAVDGDGAFAGDAPGERLVEGGHRLPDLAFVRGFLPPLALLA